MEKLAPLPAFRGRRGPLVLCIMDGIGYGRVLAADAVQQAHKPQLDWLHAHCLHTRLRAHGTAVGLPADDDMGNSEVGHNAIGCGRVFAQGAKLVNRAIASGALFTGQVWQAQVAAAMASGATLHFLGLFSDGNVHSHLDHLKAMIDRAHRDGVKRLRVHLLLDGRDVGETSALDYVEPFEAFLAQHNAAGADYRIASGGGRMYLTMDRYGANWDMVKRGWDTHVHGRGRPFASAREAIETYRRELQCIDQDLHEFVIVQDGRPVGTIGDGDAVICYNFRGDRALEITAAFENDDFTKFDRAPRPRVAYAGMMEYDGDLHVPKRYLVEPPAIDRTVGEFLARAGVPTLAVSETQKYGHVTYFFNGNRTGKFDERLEDYREVPSDVVPFEERPWMKSAEITDVVRDAIRANRQRFIRLNYPNGDMVGHTGIFQATRVAVEAVDLGLRRLIPAVRDAGGILLVTADHGNADEMLETDKKTGAVKLENGVPKPKTSHTLNPVPCLIYDPETKNEYRLAARQDLGISSLAATCLNLLGYAAPADYDPAVIEFG